MKKRSILIFCLIAAMLFGMIGCKDRTKDPTEPSEEPPVSIATAPIPDDAEPPVKYKAEVGQVFEVIKLATNTNGENGVTYYYTEDGINLTPFDEWNEADGKWVHGDAGVLAYPALVPNDNYTAAGTSSTEYVAMSYEIPETGAVELFSWTVLQGGAGEHGYRVKIAMGTPDNVLQQYDVTGESQTLAYNTYGMKVTKGEKVYLIFEPLVKKDNEWFGFKLSLTYTGLGEDAVPTNPNNSSENQPEEEVDPMTVKFTKIVGTNNGTNGLTFYRTSNGTKLIALDQWDATEGKWWHGGKGVLVYPKYDTKENYGIFGSSADEYIVMGYKLPATGKIDLATWAVLQSGHDYQIKIAYNSPSNAVETMNLKGESQTQNSTNVQLDVKRGDVLYIHYKPLEAADGAWGGYKTELTYIEGGEDFQAFDPYGTVAPADPSNIQVGTQIMLSAQPSATNGENGVYFYYTSDGKSLTKFTESDGSGTDFRWYHGADGVLAYPALAPADNYGLIGTSASQYTAVGYKIPETGTIELFSWLALQSGEDYQVQIAKGTPDNILYTYNVTGASQTVADKTYTINVNKDQMLYILYKPLEVADGAWAGFKTVVTYVSVGKHTGPADPKPVDPETPPEEDLPEAKPVANLNDGKTKILAIGNSFTVDTLEYVQGIARSAGMNNVHLGKAVIGGSSIDTHSYNAKYSNKEYELGVSTEDGGWYTVYGQGLWEALQADNWDYIMIQQHSPNAGNPDSYGKLDYLMDYIAKYTHQDTKVVFNMTWAYQSDSTHEAFVQYNNDQMTMYNAITSTTQSKIASRDDIALVVPNATAVQNARTSYIGDTLTLDGYHLNYAEGRYTAAMTFAKAVLDVDLSQVTYTPAGVSELYRQVAVESVTNAMAKPYEVTASALTADKVDTSNEVHRDTLKFVDLAAATNGAKGLSFYYTANGENLTAYTLYDASQGRWYDNSDNQLNFFDPQEVKADNYGLGQCSPSKYVVMGYTAPETGSLDLFALTVIQGPEGQYTYNVRIALGTPDNTVHEYTLTGGPGTSQEERYTLDVTAGQEIFIVYENLTDGGWFGYKNSVTYRTASTGETPETGVIVGDVFKSADMAATTSEANAAGNMTIYYTSDGKNLTAFSTFDPNNHFGRWYHHNGTSMLSWVDPFVSVPDNYGWIGISTGEWVAMGYKMPAAGTIELYNWLALHNGKDIKIHIAKDTPDNVVDTLTVSGGIDQIGEKTTTLNVAKDQMIYVVYELLEGMANPDNNYAGYKTQFTYTAVGATTEPDPTPDPEPDPEPEYTVAVGDTFTAAECLAKTAEDNAAGPATIYYTSDRQSLTAFTTFDANNHFGRWYHHDGTSMLSWADPFVSVPDNYGWLGMTATESIAIGYTMPESGTIEVYNWIALHNGQDVKIYIAEGTPSNVVDSFEVVGGGDFIGERTTTLNVVKNQRVYVLFEQLEGAASPDANYFGYKMQYTYTAVGPATEPDPTPTPDPEPDEPAVNVNDVFYAAQLAPTGANGEKGMTLYYTANGTDLTPFEGFAPDVNGGRWYYSQNNALLAFVDPLVNKDANYGWIGSSGSAYVVIGYEMPATGTITLTNWLARHTAFDSQILISQGTVDNVVSSFDVVAGHENGMIENMELNVTKGQTIYVSYKTKNGPATADTCYLGYQTYYTYTALGAVEPETPSVTVGETIKFVSLAGQENGANGLTYGYTADGTTVTPYELYDASQGRWYAVPNGALIFFDPCEVVADNYGLGQTSASNNVVMTYEVPATGTIDLFTWLVTQYGTGHSLTVAKGSLDNVVGTYSTTQGVVNYQTYNLNVTKGEKLYLVFKATTPANGEWFGYQLSVTYTAVN